MPENSLAILDKATRMLAEVKTTDDAKNVMDLASAAKHYAKKHGLGQEAVSYAHSIEIKAKYKLGEILKAMKKNKGGGDPSLPPVRRKNRCQPLTYKEIGMDKKLASEAQILVSMPPKIYEQIEQGAKTESQAIREVRQRQKQSCIRDAVQSSEIKPMLHQADAFKFDPGPIDLLLTDPPYSTEIKDIEEFSSRVINLLRFVKSTGRAYIFIGPYPQELKAYLNAPIPEQMELRQILVWTYRNTIGPSPKELYKNNWQAILYFTGKDAGPLDCQSLIELFSVQDINAPDGRLGDRYHAWQKPNEIAERFIRHASKPGDLIYDPFTCTGTFLIAASRLGRKAIGCEINPEFIKIAEVRGLLCSKR